MRGPREPHSLSASFNVDPAYSATERTPSPKGLSIFSEKNSGPCWLYLFGDLATHLFNRLRREAFNVCKNVFHPGEFRSCHPTLFAKRPFKLERLPGKGSLTLHCSGHAVLRVNGSLFFSHVFPDKPEGREIDLLPHLREGDNEIALTVHSLGEPAAFLIQGDVVETDSEWAVSSDFVNWRKPDCLPFESLERFPHQEELPESILEAKPLGDGIYDFGTETFGRVQIALKGRGALKLNVGESVSEALATEPRAQEQLIAPLQLSGETYECPSNLSLRYVHLSHPATLEVKSVKLAAPLYPARYKGAFACPDEALNKIWMRSAYTLKLCMRALCVDGLKRDRLPWGGDLYMSSLVNGYSFHEKALSERSLLALYGEGPETMDVSGIVDYSLFWVISVRDCLAHFGDLDYARRVLPLVERLLREFETRSAANGFVPARKGDWTFIDWSEVGKEGFCASIQMLHAMAIDAAAEICEALGEGERASALSKKAAKLRRLCDKAFWSEERSAYVDNIVDGRQGERASRPTNVFAALSGAAGPKRRRLLVKSVLLNKDVKAVGTPYMRAFEAMALAHCGEAEAMLSVIREDWGGMVEAGATAFWEGYDKTQRGLEKYSFYGRPFAKSLCHAWSAGPVYLLSSSLLGAKALAPGWSRFTLSPKASKLEWISVAIPCPQGAIKVDVEGEDVCVSVPAGAVFVEPGPNGKEHAGPCMAKLKRKSR